MLEKGQDRCSYKKDNVAFIGRIWEAEREREREECFVRVSVLVERRRDAATCSLAAAAAVVGHKSVWFIVYEMMLMMRTVDGPFQMETDCICCQLLLSQTPPPSSSLS